MVTYKVATVGRGVGGVLLAGSILRMDSASSLLFVFALLHLHLNMFLLSCSVISKCCLLICFLFCLVLGAFPKHSELFWCVQ